MNTANCRPQRLTAPRCSGIKSGYWSQHKKDELIQRLGVYEDTGLTPEEIMMMKARDQAARKGIQAANCEKSTSV